jgi:hypothetical protein
MANKSPSIQHFDQVEDWHPAQAKWRTSKGERMPVTQMTDIHLQRTLAVLRKRLSGQKAELARMRAGTTHFNLQEYEQLNSKVFETMSWINVMQKEYQKRQPEPDSTYAKSQT